MKFSDIRAKMDPERARKNEEAALKEIETIHLGWLRGVAQKTQTEVANILGVSQAAVSSLEGREDLLISTLRKYVHAIGGSISIAINLPGGRYLFDNVGEAFAYAGEKSSTIRPPLRCIENGEERRFDIVFDATANRPRAIRKPKNTQADGPATFCAESLSDGNEFEATFA